MLATRGAFFANYGAPPSIPIDNVCSAKNESAENAAEQHRRAQAAGEDNLAVGRRVRADK